MFERFTNSARRVIFFSRNEALVAGATKMEPAHLVLGIMREAPDVFRQQMSGERFNELVETLRRHEPLTANSWPLTDVPLSDQSNGILVRAAELAPQGWVTPEALLLAILEQAPADAPLESFDITAQSVRAHMRANPAESYGERPFTFGKFTNSARRVIFHARNAAMNARREAIEPADLVLGIIHESAPLFRALLAGNRFTGLTEALQKRGDASPPASHPVNLPMSPESERAMARAEALAKNSPITPELLLLGILSHEGTARDTLEAVGLTAERVSEYLKTHPPSHDAPAGIGLGGSGGASRIASSGGASTGHPVPRLFRLSTMLPPERREAAERILLSLCDHRVQISGLDSQGSFEFKFGEGATS
jgi:ATP-dependent Clp protease ATP-binding subunit ClpA